MIDFFCAKRFDISFSELHKLIKLVLPSDYTTKETIGIYKNEYQPCSIIEVYSTIEQSEKFIGGIYCWLGRRGLTVLSNTEFTVNLCTNVLKEVKQNAEDYKILSYPLLDEQTVISALDKSFMIYHQLNSSENTQRYIIRESNNDEVVIEFFKQPDSMRVSGDMNSLLTYITLTIDKLLSSIRSTSDNQE